MSQTTSKKGAQALAAPSSVAKETMRDFIGLEQGDTDTLQAMLQFSYNSTIGNMDEAFKAIKLIKKYIGNTVTVYNLVPRSISLRTRLLVQYYTYVLSMTVACSNYTGNDYA